MGKTYQYKTNWPKFYEALDSFEGSVQELSDGTGYGKGTIYNWLNRTTRPNQMDFGQAATIASALGCNVYDFIIRYARVVRVFVFHEKYGELWQLELLDVSSGQKRDCLCRGISKTLKPKETALDGAVRALLEELKVATSPDELMASKSPVIEQKDSASGQGLTEYEFWDFTFRFNDDRLRAVVPPHAGKSVDPSRPETILYFGWRPEES